VSSASPTTSPKKPSDSSTVEPRAERRIEPRGLTIPEAAAYLGSTIWFVRTTIWSGEIPAQIYGKRYIIDRRDLDAFIERSKTTRTK
jgi:excisionase family DNA binding protein